MTGRVVMLALLLLAPLRGQSASYQIREVVDGVRQPVLDARVLCVTPGNDGMGFARIELDNLTTRPLQLRVATTSSYRGGFEASRGASVGPRQTARLCLPVMGESPHLRVRSQDGSEDHRTIGSRSGLHGVAALHVGSDGAAAADWKTLLEAELAGPSAPGRSGGTVRNELPTVGPEDLPPDARWLSGFHLILVDAAAPGLAGDAQERLAHYVAQGGALLIYRGETLAPGPLATMAPAAGAGRHGLGTWLRITDRSGAAIEQDLRPWLRHPTTGPAAAQRLALMAPARVGLYRTLSIPGLGEVPVWSFLLMILGFLGFVAHQILGVLRKRVRPTRMLVLLPATGLGFALAILGHGLLSEGLYIRGTMWSFTRLDQRDHTVAGVGTRTLYAGLSPGSLAVSPDTLLLARLHNGGERGPELRLDLDRGGRVDGAILPSRVAQSLVTTNVGRARERLRFRRRGDGALEVLAGPELRPLGHADAVLVRDFAGHTFRQSSPGVLTAIDHAAPALLTRASESLAAMPHGEAQILVSPLPRSSRAWSTDWLREQLGDTLAPGSYLAWVEAPPAFDPLGLEVEYREAVHLVLGLLAAEDILD